jgi:hypothetical protein
MAVTVEWVGGFRGPPGEAGWRILDGMRETRVVARSRTTATESGILDLPDGPVPVHRKTYSYRGLGALLSGAFRTTFAAPGRARLEVEALLALGALGLAPPPVALAERRTAGFLREAVLAVRTVDGGTGLDGADPAGDLAAAVGRAAAAMHAAGLGDLSLAPRNLVVARGPGGWTVAKVDSGSLRPVARGGPEQSADLADLLAGLEGRWDAESIGAIRDAYAGAMGTLPDRLDGEMARARSRRERRKEHSET